MSRRAKIVDIHLDRAITGLDSLDGYAHLSGLVRLHNAPLGWLHVPVRDGRCDAEALRAAIVDHLESSIYRHLVRDALAFPQPGATRVDELFAIPHPEYTGSRPTISVAVCTRDRTADLEQCLAALLTLEERPLEILVIDNAPATEATARLIAARFPAVRCVREPRPGLDWARNRAIAEARGEVLAFTDDDVIVDPHWTRALGELFGEHPEIAAVTGLVVPFELETDAQALFEQYGGFGRGFSRRWYRVVSGPGVSTARLHGGTGKFGTGANMAYRRSVFDRIGGFDPALDVGTVTNGGGDLEMFFRVLKEGGTLVYEPAAIVRHRHRRDYDALRAQLTNNGIGFFSYLVRSGLAYPDERWALARLGFWWLRWWNLRRLLISFVRPRRFPRDLIAAELWGSLVGLTRYPKARRRAHEIAKAFAATTDPPEGKVDSPA